MHRHSSARSSVARPPLCRRSLVAASDNAAFRQAPRPPAAGCTFGATEQTLSDAAPCHPGNDLAASLPRPRHPCRGASPPAGASLLHSLPAIAGHVPAQSAVGVWGSAVTRPAPISGKRVRMPRIPARLLLLAAFFPARDRPLARSRRGKKLLWGERSLEHGPMWHKRVSEEVYRLQLAEWYRRWHKAERDRAAEVRRLLDDVRQIHLRRSVYDIQTLMF